GPRANRASEPTGVMTTACLDGGAEATREAPSGESRGLNRTPVRDRPGRMGWRRGPQYRRSRVTPVEGRGLSSRSTHEGVESREIDMSLTPPPKVGTLQDALHTKAKASPDYRFYALYDKI